MHCSGKQTLNDKHESGYFFNKYVLDLWIFLVQRSKYASLQKYSPSLPPSCCRQKPAAPWMWKTIGKRTLDREGTHTKPCATLQDLRLRSRRSDFTLRVNLLHLRAFLTMSASFSCLTLSNHFSRKPSEGF